MSAEILCHPGNTSSLQRGVSGITLALLCFIPSFAIGFACAAASFNFSETVMEMEVIAETVALCFGLWSVYLMYDLHRSHGSLKRLLCWGSIIGVTMGLLTYISV